MFLQNISLFINVSAWSYPHQGGLVVVTDMLMSITSMLLNIMVIMAIREDDRMSEDKFNISLVNLCSSNLVSCVFVKSISIVHNSYMVAANTSTSSVPFCGLYTVSWRATWATLPWTIVVISWILLLNKFYQKTLKPAMVERDNEDEIKSHRFLAPIWIASLIYCLMSEESEDQQCSVNDDPSSMLGLLSITAVIVLPTLSGPVLVSLLFLGISFINCMKRKIKAISNAVHLFNISNAGTTRLHQHPSQHSKN